MYKLNFYVPESHVESVKQALFAAGAGRIGQYECCSWQVLGEGQFKPMEGSQPFLGQQGLVEKVAEYKVEMVCDDAIVDKAIRSLLTAHPYEEPAYEVYPLYELKESHRIEKN